MSENKDKGYTIVYFPWEDLEGKPRVAGRFKTKEEKDEYIKCINLACKPKEYNPDIIPLRKFYYYKLCDSDFIFECGLFGIF